MMNPTADNNILGHVHKYQAVLWRHWKNQEKLFLLQNDQFLTKGVEIFRKCVF